MDDQLDRREFLKQGTAGAAAAAATSAEAKVFGQEQATKPIRVGLIGCGGRGRWLLKLLMSNMKGVSIPAVCDYREDRLKMTVEMVKKAKGNTPAGYSKDKYDYRNMCQRDDLDAVVVATDVQWEARISADALKAGKHVGCEVCGAHTLEDCYAIVEAKEKSGKRYMLLENCCYGNENMTIFNMVRQGLFGELYCGECSYIHDGRPQYIESDGSLTWRGELARYAYGSYYQSHALGSVAKWLGINDGDRMEYCTCMQNDPKGMHHWIVERYGADSELAKTEFKRGDYITALIHTVKGRVIRFGPAG